MTISEEKIIKELQSLLEDDARILTYKYVSHKFQVHVNKAKSYLETVYNSMNDSSVSALYFVCGHSIESPNTLKVMLVAGERLEKVLSQLDPVLSQHIYSLQSQPVRNTNTIYGADAQENLLNTPIDNSLCSIRHPTAHRLSDAEMKQSAPVIKQKANGLTNGNYSAADRTTSKPALNIKTEAIEKPAVKPEPSQASSHVEKSAVKTEPAQVSSRVEKTNSSTKEKKHGIASMFAQANAVQKRASPSCDETKATDSKNRSNESSRKPAAKPAASDESVRFGKRGVSGGSGGKSSREPQKRRRVLALVSSSDEESEEEQHEEVPPSPPAQQETGDRDEESSDLPPSDSSARVPEKRCTRKLVDKTYVDEDGFMVTKKVYENVAESDLEQEETAKEPTDASTKQPVPDSSTTGTNDKTSPKPPNSSTPAAATSGKTKKTPPKAAAAQKPKQANIMNFFKRK